MVCRACLLVLLLFVPGVWAQAPVAAWGGVLRNQADQPLSGATITLSAGSARASTVTSAQGSFAFPDLAPGTWTLSITWQGRTTPTATRILIPAQPALVTLTLSGDTVILALPSTEAAPARSGGEQLGSKAVSEIPLNKRDLSQILLLAAGTATDPSGAVNYTQQFAINGQRGVEATFALDGADTSDPEVGGGTFSNFNVDAVLELQSLSGVMPAEVGRGASGLTNVVTRSGTDGVHGSVFEFLRNSALDARNYFDFSSPANPGRIPPFKRNEFGFTNGGPVLLPRGYDGRGRTFYFVEYQGFRQILGTTQNFAVPTAQERSGVDTTAFPGDTLQVPVDAAIAGVLARYPLPNLPSGTFGPHTYATSARVVTDADQFSVRVDHRIRAKQQLLGRFTLDNLTGPVTNPDQTVLDPSFGVEYVDRQRNGVLTWTGTPSPRLLLESSISFTRTTPSFPTADRTDPAIKFNDGLYEAFNAPAGSVIRAFGNLFQARQNVSYTTTIHSWKAGAELRLNRDTTYFGISPNGEYDFGGGTAYSPVAIRSQSGAHDVLPGAPLPDTLAALLTGSPFTYTVAVAPSYFSNGQSIGAAAINRNNLNLYVQDTWKATRKLVINYGLRYELYTPIAERAHRTSGFYPTPDGGQEALINPHPAYRTNMNNWGPRASVDERFTEHFRGHAAAGLTTIPVNIWQDNDLTGGLPFVLYPRVTAAPGAQVHYGFQIRPSALPPVYTPAGPGGGTDIFASGSTKNVPVNTVLDINRLEATIGSLSGGQSSPLNVQGVDRGFGNALLGTWTLGLEREFLGLTASANYVGTAAWKLPRISFPNAFPGATAQFARFTEFNAAGLPIGGFGTESLVTANSHSSYNALQLSAQGVTPHGGPGVQASYTWSKSIDDTSTVAGTSATSTTGAIAQAPPQNPFDTHAERGPSTFDTTHAFTLSLTQDLPLHELALLNRLSRKLTDGWELISISTLASGSPFTVYSGLQQTGAGSAGTDRPDLIGKPALSSGRRPARQDYFGRGANNASFFSIPVGVPGGTGPNSGRFGTLGRDSFRGPAFYDFDFSLVKDTPVGRRASGSELMDIQFRSEFFNLFNIADLGLPANTLLGSGFGEINRTAGSSRQIQFSLKFAY